MKHHLINRCLAVFALGVRASMVWAAIWALPMTPAHAGNYPLGSMTCADIGRFASEGMRWREQGLTPREALARLQQLQPEGSVEYKNMRNVLMLIWGGYGDAWTVESAGDTMRKDCEAGR